MDSLNKQDLNSQMLELTRIYTEAASLEDFAAAVSVFLEEPVRFSPDGGLRGSDWQQGLDPVLLEQLILLAGKLASNQPPADLSVSKVLHDLADRNILTQQDAVTRLAAAGARPPEKMLLVTLQPAAGQDSVPETIVSQLCQIAGTDWSWRQKNNLHCLLHDDTLAAWNSIGHARLMALAADCPVCGCISDEFRDLLSLSEISHATVRIAGIIQKITRQPLVVEYDRFKQADLILTASAIPDFNHRQYICRSIADIYAYDRQHGTDFLYTLYCFITSASSYVVTAGKMHLHKNTVSYRIRRLNELFNLDLETIESKFDMIFSCYILRIFEDA